MTPHYACLDMQGHIIGIGSTYANARIDAGDPAHYELVQVSVGVANETWKRIVSLDELSINELGLYDFGADLEGDI